MDLTLKLKHVTIKVRSLLCGLIVRYLVVRRTFLLKFQGSIAFPRKIIFFGILRNSWLHYYCNLWLHKSQAFFEKN